MTIDKTDNIATPTPYETLNTGLPELIYEARLLHASVTEGQLSEHFVVLHKSERLAVIRSGSDRDSNVYLFSQELPDKRWLVRNVTTYNRDDAAEATVVDQTMILGSNKDDSRILSENYRKPVSFGRKTSRPEHNLIVILQKIDKVGEPISEEIMAEWTKQIHEITSELGSADKAAASKAAKRGGFMTRLTRSA